MSERHRRHVNAGADTRRAAKTYLAKAAFDPEYGACPLKRVIQREPQDPLALQLLSGGFHPGDTIRVDHGPERLIFTPATEAEPIG